MVLLEQTIVRFFDYAMPVLRPTDALGIRLDPIREDILVFAPAPLVAVGFPLS